MRRTAFAVLTLLFGAVCVFGQQPGGQQPGGAPGGGTPRTPTTPQPGQPGQQGQRDPFGGQQSNLPDMQAQRSLFLSGKVMLDDGTAPSEPVDGRRTETFADVVKAIAANVGQVIQGKPEVIDLMVLYPPQTIIGILSRMVRHNHRAI